MHSSFRRIACSDVRLSLTPRRRATLRPISTSSPPPDPAEPLTRPQLKTLVLGRYAKNGKFSGLARHVLASPSVLLAACRNLAAPSPPDAAPLPPPPPPPSSALLESVSRRFSLSEMGREIAEGRFDVASCCVAMAPSRKKGEPLLLPGLKLVLIEALRMVREVVYDERFATFAFSGRVDVGRHTAVRYLKASVQNLSWWFTVKFDRQKFDCAHVSKLRKVIEEKIDDSLFIDLIRRLFECQAGSIELGGCYLERGFPRERIVCNFDQHILQWTRQGNSGFAKPECACPDKRLRYISLQKPYEHIGYLYQLIEQSVISNKHQRPQIFMKDVKYAYIKICRRRRRL